jgi:hypothetical protein
MDVSMLRSSPSTYLNLNSAMRFSGPYVEYTFPK